MNISTKQEGMFEDFKIKIFITVAEEGSFTKAASALGITQPAVSQNIAELERQAGAKLLLRERGSVSLTAQGRILLKYAIKLTALGLSADRIFTQMPPARITVRTSDELWKHFLKPTLEDFHQIHPEVTFLRTTTSNADLTLDLVPASMLGTGSDVIGKVRVSLSPVPVSAEDYSFNREKTFTFDLSLKASSEFGGTPVYQILRAALTDVIEL